MPIECWPKPYTASTITPLPFRETFKATTHPTINTAWFAPGRVHALETVRLVSVVPFSLHRLLGEFDKKVLPRESQNMENWRWLKMNEPRKVNRCWPWKGIIWKGTLHTTILQDLCSFSDKSMSSSLESEWGLWFSKSTNFTPVHSTLLFLNCSFRDSQDTLKWLLNWEFSMQKISAKFGEPRWDLGIVYQLISSLGLSSSRKAVMCCPKAVMIL